MQDNADALDLPTVKAWSLIVRLAVAEYLGLDPSAPIPNLNTPTEVKRDPRDLVRLFRALGYTGREAWY